MTRKGHSESHAGKTGAASDYSPGGRGSHGLHSENPHDEERSFSEIRRALNRAFRIITLHPWAFFIPFCTATSGVFIASLYLPRTYSAFTSFQRRNDPVGMNIDMSDGAASFHYFRSTIAQDITSIACIAEAADSLTMTPKLERNAEGALTLRGQRAREVMAASLAGHLKVGVTSPDEQVDNVTISYTGPDPELGAKLVEAVKHIYIRRTREWIRQYLTDQREYFAVKFSAARDELTAARREATRLRLEHPLVDPTDPGAITARISQLESERRELLLHRRNHQADLLAQQQVMASLPSQGPTRRHVGLSATPSRGVPTPSAAELNLAEEIRAIERDIEELRNTRGMTVQHPDIIARLEKRQRLEDDLAQQQQAQILAVEEVDQAIVGPEPTPAEVEPWQIDRARAEVMIAALEDKVRDVDLSLDMNEKQAKELAEVKQNVYDNQEEFSRIRDWVTKARDKYSELETTLAAIDPAIEATSLDRLVHFIPGPVARASRLPVTPKLKSILLMAILAGFALGVGCVILAETLDSVYRSSAEVVRSLGLPILEAIDEIVTTHDRKRRVVRGLVVAPIIVVTGIVITGISGSMAYRDLIDPSVSKKVLQSSRRVQEQITTDESTAVEPEGKVDLPAKADSSPT